MNDGAAREVEDDFPTREIALVVGIGGREHAVRTPDPVRDRRVDADRPEADEPQHRREFHALGEGAGDEGGRDDREGHLEAHIDRLGDRRREAVGIADAPVVHVAEDVLQERATEAADECASGCERQAVGDDGVDHRDQAGDRKARHHGVADVLLAHHAAVEEPEAGNRHHQDESDRGEHPRGVAAGRGAIGHDRRDRGDGGEFIRLGDRGDGGGAGGGRRRRGLGRGGGSGRCSGSSRRGGGGRRGGRGRVVRARGAQPRKGDQTGDRQRGREPAKKPRQFHLRELQLEWDGPPQRASESFSPVRMRTAESMP